MKRKIIINVGIPASGKSTETKKQIDQSNGTAIRLNRDSIRQNLFGKPYKYTRQREKAVTLNQRNSLEFFMTSPDAPTNIKTIFIDDTNVNNSKSIALDEYIETINEELSKNNRWEIEYKIFKDSFNLDLCIKRNTIRDEAVPLDVMYRMYDNFIDFTWKAQLENLQKDLYRSPTVIFDVDGTLAHMRGRGAHDYTKYKEDSLDSNTYNLLNHYRNTGHKIIIMTGRDYRGYDDTKSWLDENKIYYDLLLNRKMDDTRNDAIVKYELYRDNVYPYYDVKLIFDDRNRVVRMWRALGLTCYQVANGDF